MPRSSVIVLPVPSHCQGYGWQVFAARAGDEKKERKHEAVYVGAFVGYYLF